MAQHSCLVMEVWMMDVATGMVLITASPVIEAQSTIGSVQPLLLPSSLLLRILIISKDFIK